MKIKAAFALATLAFSSMAHSYGAANYDVLAVGCMPNGSCFINISPAAANTTCPNKAQIRFNIALPGSNAQYSAALAALAANKQINVAVTDVCLDNYPTPDWLQVNK